MTRLQSILLGASLLMTPAFAANSIHEFTMNDIDGKPFALAQLKGKAVVVVNVASRCGYTPQYAGLEALYQKYKSRGLVIVGVPANNFGGQEPGTDAEIKQFCSRTYSVSFPMLSKVSVKGADIVPLYAYLTGTQGGDVKWNFTKFLVDKDGKVAGRFEPKTAPDAAELAAAIEQLLK
jgi:glutathione peroxidase